MSTKAIRDIYIPNAAALSSDTVNASNKALKTLAKRLLAAGNAALQMEKQLLKFDEINRLEATILEFSEQTSKGSGSSKKSSTKSTDEKKTKPSPHSEASRKAAESGKRPSPHSAASRAASDSVPSGHSAAPRNSAKTARTPAAGASGSGIVDEKLQSLLDGFLEFDITDIKFGLGDGINWEAILTAGITGLFTALGGILGFTLIPGGSGTSIGIMLGAAIGLSLSSLLFDFDGTVSKEEANTLFLSALGGILGGIAGLVFFGPVGGLIGLGLGFALSLLLQRLETSNLFTGITEAFNRLRQTVSQKWEEIKLTFSTHWQNLRSWWSSLSLGNFNVRLPHLQVQWQELSPNSILSRYLGLDAIPHLYVEWYARGGIVDGATLIGAGEQGKEAIVPLERHTEWIRMVALELARQLELLAPAKAMQTLPLPAAATGALVPPNAVTKPQGEGIDLNSLADAIARAVTQMAGQNRSEEPVIRVYLDGRQLSDAVTRYQRNAARMAGA